MNGVWAGGQYAGNSHSARGSSRSGVTQTASVVKVNYKRGDKRGMTYQAVGFR